MSWITQRVPIVEYGTEQFNDWLSDKTVTPQQAWEIQVKYRRSTTENPFSYIFWICVGDEYLFSTSMINKLRKVSLEGLYVDTYSGAVRYHRTNETYTLRQIYATPDFYYLPKPYAEPP